MKRRTFVGLAAAGTIGLAGCASDPAEAPAGDESTDETRSSEETDRNEETDDRDAADAEADEDESDRPVRVGELVEGEPLAVVVNGVESRQAVDEPPDEADRFGSDDGRRTASGDASFVVVNVAVENTSDEFVPVDGAFRPVLHDEDDDREYSLVRSASAAALADEPGHLAPGEVERGDLVYEVLDDRTASSLVLEGDAAAALGRDSLVVDLTAAADPIATLEQELRVPVNEFGTAVDVGAVEVSVDEMGLGNNLGPFISPDDDHEYIVVGVAVTNDAGTPQELSLADRAQLKDHTGRSYPEDPTVVSALDEFDDSPIDDGERRTGTVAYQVEQGLDELYWAFDPPTWADGEKTFWRLR